MDLHSFCYDLPPELIAQTPARKRDHSRLLVANRASQSLQDHLFYEIPHYFNPGDVLVLNDTYVFPARLFGVKQPSGAAIEMLLLENQGNGLWEVIAYRASRLKVGTQVQFSSSFYCIVNEILKDGKFLVQFFWEGDWDDALARHGEVPLPPYIAREHGKTTELDHARYQTVFAQPSPNLNSAAAPTAGLHFTETVLQTLRANGVRIAYVTLRVGLDTFLPMRVDRIEDHKMHTESFTLSPEAAQTIETAIQNQNRVIAVGTTAMRVLESAASAPGRLTPGENRTNLFIYPGYPFKIVSAMVTNFHLPKTTLILLVSAFMGNDFRARAYQHAIENKYRFYSYGDAMLIL
ncbi:MAG: tRNA preQ1(34) S-adenosylmethionine ribosyltransferase-isomerase QueA [bacterium]|jgi:S-adenosylmethionine:tRNA ribosyltransferase-isomerase|nr:tRNA preQ1(34) S-adenosylmethionine ribosyltransferase-isomerase QueA [bacterium]